MAIAKTIIANGSKNHHKFSLTVNEDRTSGNSSFLSFSFVLSPIQTGWDWSGWGSNISYVINIGNNSYNGTIASYNGSSSVTLKSESDIEIAHETDGSKTIDISFSVTDTSGVNYTCGNASQKSTLELSRLHEAPLLSNVTFEETNQQLKNIGVGDDYFVTNLSVKNVTIVGTTSDNAKITKYEIINGDKVYSSTTNVVAMNLKENSLEVVYDENLKRNVAKLTIRLTDNLGGVSSFAYPYNYVILYTKPSIEKTSTTIKRKTGNGTVLTDNKALLNFVGTCYKGNDVVGNNNEPKVEYKIWNGAEPSYTPLTISNVANVIIKDYELTDLLYTNAYNYKIKIYDSFTTEETTINIKEDKVPTGVSVWTEYKDRVDFINATIGGQTITLEPIMLYEGSSKEKITLNDSVTNYKRIEIFYHADGDNAYSSTPVDTPNGKNALLLSALINLTGNYVGVFERVTIVSISDKTITPIKYGQLSAGSSATDSNYITITKVIGYK